MKEIYTAPEMEVVEFESEDIITTSATSPDFSGKDDDGNYLIWG